MQHILYTLSASITLAVLIVFNVNGQNGTEPNSTLMASDTVDVAFLPALAYNSDMGLIGGGLMSRYHFKGNTLPFYSFLNINAIASTKGLLSVSILYDKPNLFSNRNRLTSEVYVSRFLENQYYGIGRYDKLPDPPADNPDYYFYKSFISGVEVIFRQPLRQKDRFRSGLDLYGALNIEFRTNFGKNSDRLITLEQPLGTDDFRTVALGTGLIWEGRDNEFDPTKGGYAKMGTELARNYLGSTTNYLKISSEIRSYVSFHILRRVTWANRLSYIHSSGTLPYWQLPELGGEVTLRGYPENRFRDDNAVFVNSELRTWLIEFPDYEVKLGGTIFVDAGRTFPNCATFNNVVNDIKYAYGFGGTSSFFNKNFILRGDIGFSDEGYGIYFTAGYMF